MGAYSRNKGSAAERELVRLLSDWLGIDLSRNLKQYQQAQHGDIEQLVGGHLVEVKNCAKLQRKAWWSQAVTAAGHRSAIPCVAYRLPNLPMEDRWRFIVPLSEAWQTGQAWRTDFRYACDVGIDGFALLCRERGG